MAADSGTVIRTTEQDGVWIVSFARPPMNAIDLSVIVALGACVQEAADSASCRAMVVTGDPPAFSAGIDVKAVPAYDAATRAEMIRCINRCILQFYGLPKPTVAAINGHALGAGLVLALACDFRLAAAGSYRLGLTEVTAGIPFPAAPLLVVQAELDHDVARRLTLSGAVFGPEDSVATTFLDDVAPADQLVPRAIDRATTAARASAYAAVKRQLKAAALERIARVVEADADPLLAGWI
jgi:enoyl-CoA hydratase